MAAAEDKVRFSEIAEELGLTGDEHDEFVGTAMLKKGYKAVTDWMDPEPETPEAPASGGFFRPGTQSAKPPVKRVASPVAPAAAQRSGGQY